MFRTVNTGPVTTAATVATLSGQIKARYWRVVVTNGATAMTTLFELTATESNAQTSVSIADPNSNAIPTIAALSTDGNSQYNDGIYTGSCEMAWNGTGWDRTLSQPIGTNAASATKGSLVVQGSSSGTPIPTTIAAGTAAIGTVQPGNTANTTPWLTSQIPTTAGGLTTTKLISAASTNATSVKTSAGQVYNIQAFNTNASARFLKLYNKASSPTVGTDTPVNTFLVPGNATGSGIVVEVSNGIAFATGIAFAITGAIADSDTTAIGASDCVVNIQYK